MPIRQHLKSYDDFYIASFFACMAILLFFWNPSVLREIEANVLDWHYELRGDQPITNNPVIIVTIDDHSLKKYGAWPWPRARLAHLNALLLHKYQVKTLATDMIFSEAERNVFQETKRWMVQHHLPIPEPLQQKVAQASGDKLLARIWHNNPKVVQGFFYSINDEQHSLQVQEEALNQLMPCMFSNITQSANSAHKHIIEAQELTSNIPLLGRPKGGCGFLNFIPDEDGSIRFVPVLMQYQGFYFPSLALAALRNWSESSVLQATVLESEVILSLDDLKFFTSLQGLVWPNFQGAGGSIQTYSALDVLDGSIALDALKGKLVFLGVSATGIDDIRATPTDPIMSGTEVQAQITTALMHGQLLTRPNTLVIGEFLLILFIMLSYGLCFKRVMAVFYGLLSVPLLALALYSVHLLFLQGLWLHIVLPLLQWVLTFITLTVWYYIRVLKERIYLRQVFTTYIDPSVVAEATHAEEAVSLGGVEREISVLFMDVAGFTSFSERLQPQEVVSYINQFFDAATPIIHKHGGCIDRLTGDGLIALFGAPIEDPEHAVHACRSALELKSALKVIEPIFQKIHHPLSVRVGINSGKMVVGNMGSTARVQYTFMGDAGNTAARLESLNKQYGTLRMIGKPTWEVVSPFFRCRELDRVFLVGKNKPFTVYELLDEDMSEQTCFALIKAYSEALAYYRQGDFSQARKLFSQTAKIFDDPASEAMMHRCQQLLDAPFDTWDGTWKLHKK